MGKLKKEIAIVGLGSQALSWALNLRDSGENLSIALNKNSSSLKKAHELKFKTIELESIQLKSCEIIALLIPDDQHQNFFLKNAQFIHPDTHIIYAHGFSVSKHKLNDHYDSFSHSLLAPKAIASEVRFQYETRGKIGAAYAASSIERETELRTLAESLGFTALYQSTFDEECLADLFSEQSLLCSLIPYASLKSYNLLRKSGVKKEIAFMECFLELKSISAAFVNLGPEDFFKLISPNALIGSEKGKNLLLDKTFDEALDKILIDIKNKKFYEETQQDVDKLRGAILSRWQSEELTETYKKLKSELLP